MQAASRLTLPYVLPIPLHGMIMIFFFLITRTAAMTATDVKAAMSDAFSVRVSNRVGSGGGGP
jgi:hypothetical protein